MHLQAKQNGSTSGWSFADMDFIYQLSIFVLVFFIVIVLIIHLDLFNLLKSFMNYHWNSFLRINRKLSSQFCMVDLLSVIIDDDDNVWYQMMQFARPFMDDEPYPSLSNERMKLAPFGTNTIVTIPPEVYRPTLRLKVYDSSSNISIDTIALIDTGMAFSSITRRLVEQLKFVAKPTNYPQNGIQLFVRVEIQSINKNDETQESVQANLLVLEQFNHLYEMIPSKELYDFAMNQFHVELSNDYCKQSNGLRWRPCDLIIGQDLLNTHFLIGEKSKMTNELELLPTKFGYALYGVFDSINHQVENIHHSKIDQPVLQITQSSLNYQDLSILNKKPFLISLICEFILLNSLI